jgi:hypothetical protein
MTTVINEFNTRVKEIEVYFVLLEEIINQNAALYFPSKTKNKTKKIDEDLIKVLKANSFLLLYNLIESSIKLSITEIYDQISIKNKKYSEVVTEIRKIWITENYKNFQGKGTDFIFDTINNIAEDVISIKFNPDKIISGNIDGRKVRDFASQYGFSDKAHHLSKNGVRLHQVKTQRNLLAHGGLSFTECGRQYTYEDLVETKRQVIIYLRSILKNIDNYLAQNKYIV